MFFTCWLENFIQSNSASNGHVIIKDIFCFLMCCVNTGWVKGAATRHEESEEMKWKYVQLSILFIPLLYSRHCTGKDWYYFLAQPFDSLPPPLASSINQYHVPFVLATSDLYSFFLFRFTSKLGFGSVNQAVFTSFFLKKLWLLWVIFQIRILGLLSAFKPKKFTFWEY